MAAVAGRTIEFAWKLSGNDEGPPAGGPFVCLEIPMELFCRETLREGIAQRR